MKHVHCLLVCVLTAALLSCTGVRSNNNGGSSGVGDEQEPGGGEETGDEDSNSGGDEGPSLGTERVWLRSTYSDGTAFHQFVEVNRSNFCAFAQDRAGAASELSATAADLLSEFNAGTLDQGEYNLNLCLAFRGYYQAMDPLIGNIPYVSTTLGLEDPSEPPSEGLFLASWSVGQLPEQYDGRFSATHVELAPQAYSSLAQLDCSEESTFAHGNASGYGYGYPDGFGEGYLEGELAIHSAGADAWDLILTDGEYYLTYPGTTPTGDPKLQTISIDATFGRCDLQLDVTAP
ncbi:MAG TPA: hypothetical protein DIU15_15325 [Deltaproteobacteria bacterium]|nr:hypothetical protein [Deltaproteobacteria bacterium]